MHYYYIIISEGTNRLVRLQLIMEWYLDLGVDIPVGSPPQHKLCLEV